MAAPTEQVTEQVERLLGELRGGTLSSAALMERLGISHRPTFLYRYMHPALEGGWIAMTAPDHPRSSKQRYRLTPHGAARLGARRKS